MTWVRVSVEGREHTFPLGTTVRIGTAPAADMVLKSPVISPYHARIFSDGRGWWLAAEAGTDVWVAGGRISTIAVQDETSAWLGPHGEIALRLHLVTAPQQPTVSPQPGTPQPPTRTQQAAVPRQAVTPQQATAAQQATPPQQAPTQLIRTPMPAEHAPVRGGAWNPQAAAGSGGPGPTAARSIGQGDASAAPAAPGGWAEGTAGQTITGLTISGQDRLPVVITRIGGVQQVFPVGTQVRVGRDPALELVSVNPLVSRQVHGLITSDERGATYTDMSRRGTFLNGKKLHGPLRVTESVILRLGDPATGEELGITPPLTSTEIDHNRERRVLRGRIRAAAVAAAAVAGAAGLAAYFLTGSGSPARSVASGSPLAGGTQEAVLLHAEDATVRLLLGSPSNYTGWGSGTVITSTGLILTNAHVAEPQAPGAAVALGLPSSQLDANPPYLTVEITTGPASPVMARYRARPVTVDGYLDFAVVQIYATSNGTPVNPATLHLPYLPMGNDTGIQLDQPVTVLGFPGSPTLTRSP